MLAIAGCAPYVSNYRPPLDGRARAVWDTNGEMVVEPSGLVLTAECGAAIRALTGRERMPVAGGSIELPGESVATPAPVAGTWQPIYYGDPIAVSYGSPVLVQRPVFFWIPGLYWHDSVHSGRYGAVSGGSIGRALANASGGRGGGGRGGSGGGGGGGGDEGAVIVAVLAAITLPIVDLAVASASPISQRQASATTDLVAAWNDLARTPGSPCSMPGGATPMPAELLSVPAPYGAR